MQVVDYSKDFNNIVRQEKMKNNEVKILLNEEFRKYAGNQNYLAYINIVNRYIQKLQKFKQNVILTMYD